ncbi:MAG TPA: YncE family protein [Rhizomicrobium sp.]|jgi:DNA-binding beta-propeller fold protein YncE
MRIRNALTAAAMTLAVSSVAAQAELAISANDGKQLRAGDPTPVTPDSVSVIDLGHFPPKVLGTVNVPASMIGPPGAVAIGPREKFAIVTAAEKYNPADPNKPSPDDKVSVIDLSVPSKPTVIQTLSAGTGASGTSINKAGTLALVAAKGDDAIAIFSVAGNKLTPVGKVQLEPKSAPTDVVFSPDGRKAYVVAQGASKIVELAVNGTGVTRTGNDTAPGRMPYGAVITPDNAYEINTNLGGSMDAPPRVPGQRGPRVGTISMIDLNTHQVVASVEVGQTPEHVGLSPDGKYVAVVVANGTASAKSDPKFASVLGILRVFAVGKGTLTEVTHTDSGHWCQGATFSDNGRLVLLQCATERDIEVYRFDGKSLTQDKSATLTLESRPGSISTLRSR